MSECQLKEVHRKVTPAPLLAAARDTIQISLLFQRGEEETGN